MSEDDKMNVWLALLLGQALLFPLAAKDTTEF